jgi:hypothetical protein
MDHPIGAVWYFIHDYNTQQSKAALLNQGMNANFSHIQKLA